MKPLIRPKAAADIEEAFLWYEKQRSGLGIEFLTAVDQALDDILENPRLHRVLHRETRRATLQRFPYSLFYRIIDDGVIVVGCFHGSRSPRRWEERS